jgi:hypothetical protein
MVSIARELEISQKPVQRMALIQHLSQTHPE